MASRPTLPFFSYLILPDAVFAFIIATRPSPILRFLASVFLVYMACYTSTAFTTGDPGGDYGIGSVIGGQVFNVLVFLWLANPMKDFHYTYEPADSMALELLPLSRRFYYAWCILRNPRLIGLNVQVPNVPPPFRGTRHQFIRSRILKILQCILFIDLGQSFIHTHPVYFLQGTPYFPTGFRGYLIHTLCQISWITCGYATLKLVHTLISLFCVCTQFISGDPALWPDLFGHWSDAYTVRRLWGRVWHQTLARYFYPTGKGVVRALGVQRGTFFSSEIQVWVAFTTSGLIHCLGDVMLGGGSTKYLGCSVPFFLMNAAAITFEDTIFILARALRIEAPFVQPNWVMRSLGLVWVILWINSTVPVVYTWTFKPGMGLDEMLPFSIVRIVVPETMLRALDSLLMGS